MVKTICFNPPPPLVLLLGLCTPDVFLRSRWKTHARLIQLVLPFCKSATRGHRGSPCVVWMVSPSSLAKVTSPCLSWLMTCQNNLPIFEPLCSFPHTRTHICMHLKTHSDHIDVFPTAEGIAFMKDLQAALLFVCLHLWLRFGSLRSPHSHLIHPAAVQIQFYMLLYLELSCANTV